MSKQKELKFEFSENIEELYDEIIENIANGVEDSMPFSSTIPVKTPAGNSTRSELHLKGELFGDGNTLQIERHTFIYKGSISRKYMYLPQDEKSRCMQLLEGVVKSTMLWDRRKNPPTLVCKFLPSQGKIEIQASLNSFKNIADEEQRWYLHTSLRQCADLFRARLAADYPI